jgi:hypothetical protein
MPLSKFPHKGRYRDHCLPDMNVTRTDTSSLEYVVWRMTQQRWEDRVHDFDEMRRLVDRVTRL